MPNFYIYIPVLINILYIFSINMLSYYIRFLPKYQNKHRKQYHRLTANVFPDPVWAIPTMSLPLRATGKPWAWIAVGSLKFCCTNTSITYSARKTTKN